MLEILFLFLLLLVIVFVVVAPPVHRKSRIHIDDKKISFFCWLLGAVASRSNGIELCRKGGGTWEDLI
jgi:hypothetical protein